MAPSLSYSETMMRYRGMQRLETEAVSHQANLKALVGPETAHLPPPPHCDRTWIIFHHAAEDYLGCVRADPDKAWQARSILSSRCGELKDVVAGLFRTAQTASELDRANERMLPHFPEGTLLASQLFSDLRTLARFVADPATSNAHLAKRVEWFVTNKHDDLQRLMSLWEEIGPEWAAAAGLTYARYSEGRFSTSALVRRSA